MIEMPADQQDTTKNLKVLVFSGSETVPPGVRIEAALRQALPDLPSGPGAGNDTVVLIPYEGKLITIMGIAAPAPISKADPQFTNAWYWPNAWTDLSGHRSHLIVSVGGGTDGVERARLLVRVLSALIGVVAMPIGVCNTTSGALLPTAMLLTLPNPDGPVAVPLFLSCFFAREADGTFPKPGIFASTKGLGDFGLMEIEVRGYRGQVPDL